MYELEMVLLKDVTTQTYWPGGQYLVDVSTTPEEYEAYIYNTEMGVKEFMFGVPKEDISYFDFLNMVSENSEYYIEIYREEYSEDQWEDGGWDDCYEQFL